MWIFIIIISLTALLLILDHYFRPTIETTVEDEDEDDDYEDNDRWPLSYEGLTNCPACGKEIDKDSRKGERIGECPFCGKPAKNK